MKTKSSIALGLTLTAIGTFTLGSIITAQLKERHKVRPHTALARVRRAFEADGPVEGAWIESKASPLNRYGLKALVYYGGITKYEDNELIQYEFIADAFTGTIIDIYRR